MRTKTGFALLAGCLALVVAGSAAASQARELRPSTRAELWRVSTRHLPSCWPQPGRPDRFRYWRHDPAGGWTEASSEQFRASDEPGVPTCVLVPGSPATAAEVSQIGKEVFDRMRPHVGPGQAIRVVIWSWKTQRTSKRRLQHYRTAAGLAEAEGYCLGWFVDRMDPQVPVALVGYSFGARTVCAALHLLGDGRLCCGPPLKRVHRRRAPVTAVLLAGAVDSDWLYPGCRYGHALSQVDKMLVAKNPCDPLLRRYHVLYRFGFRGPTALGTTGLWSAARLGEGAEKYRQIDVSRIVGASHDVGRYMDSPELVGLITDFVLGSGLPQAADGEDLQLPDPSPVTAASG